MNAVITVGRLSEERVSERRMQRNYLAQDPKTGTDELAYMRVHRHVCVSK